MHHHSEANVGRPTIQDVADMAGVSKATVSAVINDKGTVKESTRATVQDAIRELNYRPRPARGRFPIEARFSSRSATPFPAFADRLYWKAPAREN